MDRLPEHLASGSIGKRKLPSQARAVFRRRRILVCATRKFVEQGYWATTVDDIAAAAQYGVGTFYEHFDGKEDCFLAALERAIETARERFATAEFSQRPGARALAAIDTALWLAENEPAAFQLVAITAPNASPRAQSRHEELVEQLEVALRAERDAARLLPVFLERGLIAGAGWALGERLACGRGEQVTASREELALALLGPYLGAADTRTLIGSLPDG
jgi:AcrR family transcriptional regulator